jgi:soluble cytochrome b562
MKQTIFLTISLLLILSGWAKAQSVPPPPTPIAESDLRDNTIRMRSVDLERVKRDADKMRSGDHPRDRELNFAEIKKDFEKIQKLQFEIIKAYTTGKNIEYNAIESSALNMSKSAIRLESTLFFNKLDDKDETSKEKKDKKKTIKDLIVELDNQLGEFVSSEMFQNTSVVNIEISDKAQLNLLKIKRLSEQLSKMAAEAKSGEQK